eukprot:SAG11_NODE_13977_length_630_cov_1.905838_1_plen_66_part_00
MARLLLPPHTEVGVLPPLTLSVEVVVALETLMDTSFGGSEVDGAWQHGCVRCSARTPRDRTLSVY